MEQKESGSDKDMTPEQAFKMWVNSVGKILLRHQAEIDALKMAMHKLNEDNNSLRRYILTSSNDNKC